MEIGQRNEIVKMLMDCMGQAIDLDSDDSDKEDILNGLTDLCKKATYLPTKKQWVKPWRRYKSRRDSCSFLTKELMLSDDASYKNYLKMSKTQFEYVLDLVDRDIRRCDTQMRSAISPVKMLALTLRFLASGESFRSIDLQTQVSRSAISGIIPKVCEAISKRMKATYLKFPRIPLEWEAIGREFANTWQFPNCLGALGGKHINFRQLRKDGALYQNYKGTNSIHLMALVDANCKFILVDIGGNGSSNDADVFLQSDFKTVLEEQKEIPPNTDVGNGRCLPFVVIANDTFPLQTHLMTPYPYYTNSREEQVFNARLSRARHVVQQTFDILANRFRVFLAPINLKVETVITITFACCVLHNFLLEPEDLYINNSGDCSAEINVNSGSIYNPQEDEAEVIRQQFMAYFNNEGMVDWV